MKKRLAALLVVPTVALATSVLAVGTAAAATGGGCRKPVNEDGLTISTCITAISSNSAYGNVRSSGANRTTIDLCVELVDANQNLVPGSRDCQIVDGADGAVSTPPMTLGSGTYYAVSYFTSPAYWYGGESPALYI